MASVSLSATNTGAVEIDPKTFVFRACNWRLRTTVTPTRKVFLIVKLNSKLPSNPFELGWQGVSTKAFCQCQLYRKNHACAMFPHVSFACHVTFEDLGLQEIPMRVLDMSLRIDLILHGPVSASWANDETRVHCVESEFGDVSLYRRHYPHECFARAT